MKTQNQNLLAIHLRESIPAAEYLQIPKNKRREPVLNEYLVTNSKYNPQKSSENKLYKTIK